MVAELALVRKWLLAQLPRVAKLLVLSAVNSKYYKDIMQ